MNPLSWQNYMSGRFVFPILCIVVGIIPFSLAQAFAQDIVHAKPGQNVTLHTGYNFSGTVYVRMLNQDTGEPAGANFWSIKEFWNKDRGYHKGIASFNVSGLRDELRAGSIDHDTIFFVTANGSVWQSVSNTSVEILCKQLDLPCKN